MTDEITVVEIPIETTFKQIQGMSIPDAKLVEEFAHSALKAVRMALAEDNIYSAIDTMDKTRLIEEYIKTKVKRRKAELSTKNIIAGDVFEMIWEMGDWLDENLVYREQKTHNNQHHKPADNKNKLWANGKPKFWLDQLDITETESREWQIFRDKLTLDQLRTWYQPLTKVGVTEELDWAGAWKLANPRPPSEKEEEIDVDISAAGKSYYRKLKKIKKDTTVYFEYLNKKEVPLREYIFMGNAILETAKGLFGAYTKMHEITEKENA